MLCDAGPRELRLELDGPACTGFDVWPQVSREDEDLHFITEEADDNFWNSREEILVDVDVVVIEVSHYGYGAFRAWKCPARDSFAVASKWIGMGVLGRWPTVVESVPCASVGVRRYFIGSGAVIGGHASPQSEALDLA